ncbi:MAG: YicC/YloC family endoribonuclease [Eubacteriales bacterium]|nr:YicC/YloC family endoribonuclease [Eubacteriales bacterium]
MLSMTGYGRAMRELDGRQLTIELKSVNHRFLDLSFRMPRNLMFLEDDARKLIGARLARGHVDVFMTYRNMRSDARKVQVDRALFDAYASALSGLTDSGVEDDRSLMNIARLPDVLVVTEAEEDQDALRALLKETLDAAVDQLVEMRRREGAEMKKDLAFRTDRIEEMTNAVEARYPETVEEYTRRLRASIEELIGRNVDETRLLTEVAVMADRSAIAEETVRLHAHIAQLRECLEKAEPVGRRIDFLVQELNREVNTISSKSQDVPITQLVVGMKAEIEKLREQLQNIE